MVEVVIDFKRSRKTDADADRTIRLWLAGSMSKEIAEELRCNASYVSRLPRISAERMGTTLKALKGQRKTRPIDPSRMPLYQRIADQVKLLWWDEFTPTAVIANRLDCSTTTVKKAVSFWFESHGRQVPNSKIGLVGLTSGCFCYSMKTRSRSRRSAKLFT
jgi:hypothetical protein